MITPLEMGNRGKCIFETKENLILDVLYLNCLCSYIYIYTSDYMKMFTNFLFPSIILCSLCLSLLEHFNVISHAKKESYPKPT